LPYSASGHRRDRRLIPVAPHYNRGEPNRRRLDPRHRGTPLRQPRALGPLFPPGLPPDDDALHGGLPSLCPTFEHILLTVGIDPSVARQPNDRNRARQQNNAEQDYRYHQKLPTTVSINTVMITCLCYYPIRRPYIHQVGQRQT
jgi:hypothetical protein